MEYRKENLPKSVQERFDDRYDPTLGACVNEDPELFFPEGDPRSARYRAQVVAAKLVCKECVIEAKCLEVALESNEEFGIWGGMTKEERKDLKRLGRRYNPRRAV